MTGALQFEVHELITEVELMGKLANDFLEESTNRRAEERGKSAGNTSVPR